MCRHVAWLGEPRTLASLIYDGFVRQAWAPRLQKHGTVNADGFGFGWYVPDRADPVRYRRAVPIWTDANLAGLADVARSGCLIAAVRTATVGMPIEETATAPFADGSWLVSLNGRVERDAVRDLVSDPESTCDAAWVASAVFVLRRAGAALDDALSEVVTRAAAKDPAARLNLLAVDGASIAATTWGDTLFVREVPDGLLVASEPIDDSEWRPVPDRHLITQNGWRKL